MNHTYFILKTSLSNTCCFLLHLILIMSGRNYYWKSIAAIQTKIDVRLPPLAELSTIGWA